jgi:hypothetical protein
MPNREVRISPDRNAIAIRSDWPADNWNAWGVMNAVNGGHWSATAELEDWDVLTVPTATVTPEPPSVTVEVPPPSE